jgi:hypothetical protein
MRIVIVGHGTAEQMLCVLAGAQKGWFRRLKLP